MSLNRYVWIAVPDIHEMTEERRLDSRDCQDWFTALLQAGEEVPLDLIERWLIQAYGRQYVAIRRG